MTKTGRPTNDPKDARISLRVAPRDLTALREVAEREGVTVGEAVRSVLRKALGVPPLPAKKRKPKTGRKA